jgi:predicted membrane protein
MVLVGHSQLLAQPLTRRQRRGLQATGAILALISAGFVVWLATHSNALTHSGHGCVGVIVAGATGGNIVHECGARARAWCHTEFARSDETALRIQQQCRIAGIKPARTRNNDY